MLFVVFAQVWLCNISTCNATYYMLVHLQGEHGTALTAKTENLAKSSEQLELVRDYVT